MMLGDFIRLLTYLHYLAFMKALALLELRLKEQGCHAYFQTGLLMK